MERTTSARRLHESILPLWCDTWPPIHNGELALAGLHALASRIPAARMGGAIEVRPLV